MTRFSQILPKDLVQALLKLGFSKIHQKGSHLRLGHLDGRKITIAIHSKPFSKGVLSAILRQAKISKKDLNEYF